MKLWKIFKEAQKHIAIEQKDYDDEIKERFICNAIKSACDFSEIPRNVCYMAVGEIEERLPLDATIETWLYDQGLINEPVLCKLNKDVQHYRIRWLKELEREFKEKDM